MAVYEGKRAGGYAADTEVTKDGVEFPLEPSLKLWNHSPTGFNWGYGGSGPAQLSLALLLDACGDAEVAQKRHGEFIFKFVAGLGETWKITTDTILSWLWMVEVGK